MARLMGRHRRRRRSPWGQTVLAGLAALVVLVWGGGATQSGWANGILTNDTNNTLSASMAITHSYAGGPCTSGPRDATVSCAGSIASSAASTATAATVTEAVKNNSSLTTPAASFTEQVAVDSCGPAEFKNAIGSDADPLLPRYGTTFQTDGPWGTQHSATFDGSTGYAADVSTTNLGTLLGSQFSMGVWFKASGTAAGGLIGLSSKPTDATSPVASPAMYMDTAGKIRFHYAGGALGQVNGVSPGAYRDGVWHLAVLSVTGTLASTTTLYIDGAPVSSATATGLLSLSGSGYWHIGWTELTGLASAPTSFYFGGGLAGAYISGGQAGTVVSGLASSSSASGYLAALSGAKDVWMLDDTGATTFTGAVGYVTGNDPCTMDTLRWSLGGTAVPAAASTLRALVQATWLPVPSAAAPGVGGSQTISTSYQRVATGYDADVSGLHLVAPLKYRIQLVNAPNWATTFRWDTAAGALIG